MHDIQRQNVNNLITHYRHEAAREAELTRILRRGLDVSDALSRHRVSYPTEPVVSSAWSRVEDCWAAFLSAAAAYTPSAGALVVLDVDGSDHHDDGVLGVHRPSRPADEAPGRGEPGD